MKVLVDQAARDRFANDLAVNLCVSASAGAGKTRSIVDRVESLMRRGEADTAERLVVVTYGEMAARELKVRCRQRIIEAEVPPGERNRLLGRFGQVYFGTIHSFCLRLLRDFGGALGLPGRIQLLSENNQLFLERFRQELDIDALDWPKDVAEVVLRYYTIEKLHGIAAKLDPALISHFLSSCPSTPPAVEGINDLLAYTPKRKVSLGTVGAWQSQIRRWCAARDSGAGYLVLPHITNGGKEFEDMATAVFEPFREWLGWGAVFLAAHIARAYREYRLSRLRLTYDDMVHEAARLIADPELLDRVRSRRWLVVLDEAQDTDATMFQILTEITRPVGAPVGTWPDDPAADGPGAGQFCFVGDDQQAIYGDRADIGRYLDYVNAYDERRGGERVEFSVTMRCPVAVVDQVNRTFPKRLIQSRATFRTMATPPWAESTGGAVLRLGVETRTQEGKINDETRFALESESIARWLGATGLSGLGIAAWEEVAVLCPRVKWLGTLADAFEQAGVPVTHKSSRLTAAEQPTRTWPLALMHVIAFPYDRFELIGVLRDIFAVPDAEIAKVHHRDPRGLSIFSAAHATGMAAEALAWLERCHGEVAGRGKGEPLARLVRRVISDASLLERLETTGGDPRALARFLHAADAASEAGNSLWQWLEEERLLLDERSSPVADSGGVNLISCHKSKGLEWPVVILAGMWRGLRQPEGQFPRILRSGRTYTVVASSHGVEDAVKQRAEALKDEEYQRLLYVAMTRSSRLLVISDPDFSKGNHSFFDLMRWTELREDVDVELAPQPASIPRVSAEVAGVVSEKDAERLRLWLADSPTIRQPHALTAGGEGDGVREQPAMVESADYEPGVGGMDYGTAWHEWIQTLPWRASFTDHKTHLLNHLKRIGDPAVSDRLEREANVFFSSDCYRDLVERGIRFFPELPFLWPQSENQWMEGVIDLLVATSDGGWWVVDWKTNRLQRGEALENWRDRLALQYRPQLEAYSAMLRSRIKMSPARLILYLTTNGDVIDFGA